MRIVCISDTHCSLRDIKIPDGDVLVHSGDLTFRGTHDETIAELAALSELPHPKKIFVPGNHDFYFDERFPDGHSFRTWTIRRSQSVADLSRLYDLEILIDRAVTINGVKFYGSPWQPKYGGWAFNLDDEVHARETWAKIPNDTNVLITHGPPAGILDLVLEMNRRLGIDTRAGCPELKKRIEQLSSLRLHVFGHLHESYGRLDYRSDDGSEIDLTFVNCAIMTRSYEPMNAPIVVDVAA